MIMKLEYSEGNWSVGKVGSVVSDETPSWYKGTDSGHDDKEYYGGFLIAESIAREADAKLMAAAKEMEHALRSFIEGMTGKEQFTGQNQSYLRQVVLPRAIEALKKAGIYE